MKHPTTQEVIMRGMALLFLLVVLGCSSGSNVVSAQTPPPDPPAPGTYPYNDGCGGCGHPGNQLVLLSTGKVQVTLHQNVGFAEVFQGPCGHQDPYVKTCVVLIEGNYSNYGVSNGKLKSLWTESTPGNYTVFWGPAVNGQISGIESKWNATAPWTATWDGVVWSVTMGGALAEINCPNRAGGGWGGTIEFAQ